MKTSDFKISATGERGLDEFLAVKCIDTGEVRPGGLGDTREWRIEARLGIAFWANDAQRAHAKAIAMRTLYAELYRDVRRRLEHLRLAISDGSRERAFTICDELDRITSGGDNHE